MIRLLLGALILAAAGWYLSAHHSELEPLAPLSIEVLLAVLVLRVANGLLQNQTMLILFRAFGPVSFWELMTLNASATFANLVAPFSGASIKALYLARQHQIRLAEFAGTMGAMAAIRIALSGLVALLGMLAISIAGGDVGRDAWLLASATAILGIGIIGLASVLSRALQNVRFIGAVGGAFMALWRTGRGTTQVFALSLVRTVTGFCAFGMLTEAVLALPRAFWIGGTMGSIATTLEVLKITPGNFGSYEALAAIAGRALGISFATGIVVAAISRIIGYASTLLLALVAILLGRKTG